MIRGGVRVLVLGVLVLGGCDRGAPPAHPARPVATRPPPPPSASPVVHRVALETRVPGDRCRRENAGDSVSVTPDSFGISREDLSRGIAFHCDLRRGHPARMFIEYDRYGWATLLLVRDLPSSSAPDTVLLTEETERPYAGASILEGEDLDGDGWTDLRVMTFHGSGGRMFDVFRYDPARRRFARDTVLSGRGNIEAVGDPPCARTSWAMGAGTWDMVVLCLRGGRWVPVRGESVDDVPALGTRHSRVSVHEYTERRGGRMRVIRSDTTRDTIL